MMQFIKQHKPLSISIAVILCLILAVGTFFALSPLKFTEAIKGNFNPSVVSLNKEQAAEAKKNISTSFSLVPEDAVMVSHINTESLTPEARDKWWDFFQKVLPPQTSNVQDIGDLEGVRSITLAVFPTQSEEYQSMHVFSYAVIFNVDPVNGEDTRAKIAERNNSPKSFVGMTETKDSFLVHISSLAGMSTLETLATGDGATMDVDPKWFPIDSEPTLYLNPGDYFNQYMSFVPESLDKVNALLKEKAFGLGKEYKWIGVSNDFGTTWTNTDTVGDLKVEGIDPNAVANSLFETVNEYSDSTSTFDPNSDINVEFGQVDMGLFSLMEAFSITTPGQEAPVGGITNPYDVGSKPIVADTTEDEYVIVFSPQQFQSVYQGLIEPYNIKTATFRFSKTTKESSLTFAYADESETQSPSAPAEDVTPGEPIPVEESLPAEEPTEGGE